MKIFSDQDWRFEHLGRKVGWFLFFAAIAVVAVILAALYRQGAFTQTTRLYFFADSAHGIAKGMSVQLSGFKIGAVEDLELEPSGQVKVQFRVKSDYLRFVTQDSEARLAKEGLFGAGFIEIVPGSKQALQVPNNGVLKFDRAEDLAGTAQALTEKIEPILVDVKKITESLNDPESDIRRTLKNVREATADLAQAAKSIKRLAGSSEARLADFQGRIDSTLDGARATLDKAGAALDTLGNTLATVDRRLPELLLRLDANLKNFESVTSDARRISATLGEELPPAIREGRGLVEQTQEIVQGARGAWPIRNFVAPPQERALPLDSHDDAGK